MMRVSSVWKLLIILVLIADLGESFTFTTRRLISRATALKRKTILYLKVGIDHLNKREDNSRHPVKTGTHTYASWKSPDLQGDVYDNNADFDNVEEYDESEDDDDFESENDIEPPSAILTWMRKLYDSMFFYGLDPAPASQRSNRRKMMRNAENSDDKKNNSPFFTASEQRVQRYMTSIRNQETPTKERSSDSKTQNQNLDSIRRTKSRPGTLNRERMSSDPSEGRNFRNEKERENQNQGKKSILNDDQKVSNLITAESAIENLNEIISDVKEELELVDAELVTSPQDDRLFPALLTKRNNILDYLEDLEVELVTIKSKLI